MKFIRSIHADKDDHHIRLVTQPYCVGMYTAGTDTNLPGRYLQLTHTHRTYKRWSKKFVKELQEENYQLEVSESDYLSFLSEEDIKNYVNK